MTRKSFEMSAETATMIDLFQGMKIGQTATFEELSKQAGFRVRSTTTAYTGARRIAERDYGIYIGSIRGVGCYRGAGEDMAKSLEPMAQSMRRIAKRSVARADLEIENNLPEELHSRVLERRNRASIIFSTSAAPMPASNRKRRENAPEAPKYSPFKVLTAVKG